MLVNLSHVNWKNEIDIWSEMIYQFYLSILCVVDKDEAFNNIFIF